MTGRRKAVVAKTITEVSFDVVERPKCRCGCLKEISNWTQECFPQAPWDDLGLAPRAMRERCRHHLHCAYRDDQGSRCHKCHATPLKCDCGQVVPDESLW